MPESDETSASRWSGEPDDEPARGLRIGIVCPYSFDMPGGVQFHVRDLAESLIARGHEVSVLAPADGETPVPDYLTSVGKAVAVPYNGSVARMTFGPRTAARARRWLAAGDFDVLHLHEPASPSLSMIAMWIAQGPIVATFHSSIVRSRALQAAYPLVRQSLEKLSARIAVSEDARRTLTEHLGGDAVVIPNGVYVDVFDRALPDPRWTGTSAAPTIAFLGRLDESRKGLQVLVEAVPQILERIPRARILVAGRGNEGKADAVDALGQQASCLEFLGGISDDEKAALLSSVDVYVAPQTGGESFGIVLVEAMSAGACVVASDLGAFRRVLDDGDAGVLFPVGDAGALAEAVVGVVRDRERREALVARAHEWVRQYDWSSVTSQVLAVYDMVLATSAAEERVREDPGALDRSGRGMWPRLVGDSRREGGKR